jgi:hypothetical protein
MCGITTWCSGWNAWSNSLGQTSNPQGIFPPIGNGGPAPEAWAG